MAAPPPAGAVPRRCFAAAAAGQQGEAPKAAVLVIGDEVLTGSITDANTPWLAKVKCDEHVVPCRSAAQCPARSRGFPAAALAWALADSNPKVFSLRLQLLHSRGVDLVRASVIGDDKREIVEEVLRLREKVGTHGFVFTSGGIGPTHDDITYEGVAGEAGGEGWHGRRGTAHQPAVGVEERGSRWLKGCCQRWGLPSARPPGFQSTRALHGCLEQ